MSRYNTPEAADAWYDDQKAEASEKGITMDEQLQPHHHERKRSYLFDAKALITMRVEAFNEEHARRLVGERVFEEGWTMDGEADLVEVDGEAV